jgi:sugar phosphate isomerase/epimerase
MPDGGIPDLASAAALLRAVAAPNLGLTIDTWHLFRTGEPVEALRALPPGSIRALQVSDARADLRGTGIQPPTADRLLPGDGAIPLREIAALALANCARVAIGVEIFDRARLADPPLGRARAAREALGRVLPQASRE